MLVAAGPCRLTEGLCWYPIYLKGTEVHEATAAERNKVYQGKIDLLTFCSQKLWMMRRSFEDAKNAA